MSSAPPARNTPPHRRSGSAGPKVADSPMIKKTNSMEKNRMQSSLQVLEEGTSSSPHRPPRPPRSAGSIVTSSAEAVAGSGAVAARHTPRLHSASPGSLQATPKQSPRPSSQPERRVAGSATVPAPVGNSQVAPLERSRTLVTAGSTTVAQGQEDPDWRKELQGLQQQYAEALHSIHSRIQRRMAWLRGELDRSRSHDLPPSYPPSDVESVGASNPRSMSNPDSVETDVD